MLSRTEFNKAQIVPVLCDLKESELGLKNMIVHISTHLDTLRTISHTDTTTIPSELCHTLDTSVSTTINQLNDIIITKIHSPTIRSTYCIDKIKSGTYGETIFERLARGLTYRYKINPTTIAENPTPLRIDHIRLFIDHNTICIQNQTISEFKFFTSADLILNADIPTSATIKMNIVSLSLLLSQLSAIMAKITIYIKSLEDDITIFNLFVPEI